MKYFLSLFLLLILAGIGAQQTCYTPAQVVPVVASLNPDPLDGNYCVTVYIEVDHDIVQDNGPVGSRTYIEGLLGEVAAIYAAQDINLSFIVKYWDVPSPYNSTGSGELLSQFREYVTNHGGHDGDVAQLLSYQASGGIAFVDVICRASFGYAFSSIQPTYRDYPVYSWSTMVISHELGHNLGSSHTQACVWNGNNTAIDACSPFGTEGGCPEPPDPVGGGTIMSYCHLNSQVGINFLKGFHPQPLAVIKNRIANAQCVECVDGPDDPVDVDTCGLNEIIVELQLDNYAEETSWQILNGDGAVVGNSIAYGKLQMNTYHADTLCLPDGCYSFVITDVDGLGGYGCSEGMYVVNGEHGELASGQNFTNSETTRFCLGITPPDGDCEDIALRKDLLTDYANQSRFPFVTVTDIAGDGVEVYGNNWRALEYAYTLTPYSQITLDFGNLTTGEIQGISLVNNVFGIWPDKSFRFAGTQNWGIPFDNVAAGETKTITIPVGQYFTGEITHIVLVSDDDVRGVVRSTWANVEICESAGAIQNKAMLLAPQGTAEDEYWEGTEAYMQGWVKRRIAERYRPYPNPVSDTLQLGFEASWHLYDSLGRTVLEGWGETVPMAALPPGLYTLHNGVNSHKIIKQ